MKTRKAQPGEDEGNVAPVPSKLAVIKQRLPSVHNLGVISHLLSRESLHHVSVLILLSAHVPRERPFPDVLFENLCRLLVLFERSLCCLELEFEGLDQLVLLGARSEHVLEVRFSCF